MALRTRLTDLFDIDAPILLAPMTPASTAELAMAVTEGGGLGLIGGGYGDRPWLERQLAAAKGHKVGCGFITWSMARAPELLDIALAARPAALMLSFADPAPFARRVTDAGIPLICQVHTLEQLARAAGCGASVIVAQGTEAGGHGLEARSTMPFVPAAADWLARHAPDVLLAAAGGIADGRGLAAALALGADGVLMGTRFWATQEADIHVAAKNRVVAADGDATVRTRVYDIAKRKDWPQDYTGRLLRNDFITAWHGREEALRAATEDHKAQVEEAYRDGDYDMANVTVGEAVGLVHDLPPAAALTRRIAAQAEQVLARLGTTGTA